MSFIYKPLADSISSEIQGKKLLIAELRDNVIPELAKVVK